MLKEPYKILRIEPEHCNALALIHSECFQEQAWSQSIFENFFTSNNDWGFLFGWIVFESNQPCGFILTRKIAQECEILTFAVRPIYRRVGIGRVLLKKLLAKAMVPIFLEVAVDNIAAINLYQSQDFKVLTIRHNYYDPKLPGEPKKDAYLMRRMPLPPK
jgi:ribosomal-protein-alanine N-acetyltransferase